MTSATARRRLQNEVIFFVEDTDFSKQLVADLKTGGTDSISVDAVRDFRTPFGNRMVIATLSVTRPRASTWDMRDLVARRVRESGMEIEINDVQAPGKPKHFRVN